MRRRPSTNSRLRPIPRPYPPNVAREQDPASTATKPTRSRRKTGTSSTPAGEPLDVQEVSEAPTQKLDTNALKQDTRLVSLLRNAVESAAADDGWSSLGAVAQRIGNQASFDSRNYGYRKLIDLIEATQLFEMERRGTNYVLRDKRVVRSAQG